MSPTDEILAALGGVERKVAASTGPRTQEGKARSSQNAVKHAILSTAPVAAGENPDEWAAHREGCVGSLRPVGYLETELANRVAQVLCVSAASRGTRRRASARPRIRRCELWEILPSCHPRKRSRRFCDTRPTSTGLSTVLCTNCAAAGRPLWGQRAAAPRGGCDSGDQPRDLNDFVSQFRATRSPESVMITVYFDSNFYVWLAREDDGADPCVASLNALQVRHVVSVPLVQELFSSSPRPDANRRLHSRVTRLAIPPLELIADFTWDALLRPPQLLQPSRRGSCASTIWLPKRTATV